MSLTAKITLSKQHLSESYDQFVRFGSKRLLIERIIGSTALVAAVVLYFLDFSFDVLIYVLLAVAVVDLLGNSVRKFFWLKKFTTAKELNSDVEFTFSEQGISSKSRFSSGELSWEGVDRVKKTPLGLLVWPTKGMYMYFPEKAVGKEVVDFIQRMAT